jgi:hypothetical protein
VASWLTADTSTPICGCAKRWVRHVTLFLSVLSLMLPLVPYIKPKPIKHKCKN